MARKFEVQSYAFASKTEVTVSYDHYNSISICNIGASAAVSVDLWITDQDGWAGGTVGLTTSGITAAETEAASTSAVTLTTSASSSADDHVQLFVNEKVWKADGTFFGTCTSVADATHIAFSGGLESQITNTNTLYVGTRYYLLNNVEIPNGATLKLSGDEFLFDRDKFNLYITPTVAAAIQTILR
jgi:hypothetical protein